MGTKNTLLVSLSVYLLTLASIVSRHHCVVNLDMFYYTHSYFDSFSKFNQLLEGLFVLGVRVHRLG